MSHQKASCTTARSSRCHARRSYPTTEQTLAALALMLNGGGLGKIQDITKAFSAAFAGRDKDLRSLIEQFDTFIDHLNDQTDDMIAATDHFNALVGQFADQKPVFDKAFTTIPDALAVLAGNATDLADAARCAGQIQRRDRRRGEQDQEEPGQPSYRTSGRFWSRWPTPART